MSRWPISSKGKSGGAGKTVRLPVLSWLMTFLLCLDRECADPDLSADSPAGRAEAHGQATRSAAHPFPKDKSQNWNCATSCPVRGWYNNVEVLMAPKPETINWPGEQAPLPPLGSLHTGAACGLMLVP